MKSNHWFDAFVTWAAVVDTTLTITLGGLDEQPSCAALGFLRALRVVRLLRLLTLIPGTEPFLLELKVSMSSVTHVSLLFAIVLFIFAAIGCVIFEDSAKQIYTPEIQQSTNFLSIANAMQQLCILATGDTWNDELIVMQGGMPQRDQWQATAFFLCFQLVAQFVLMNLFVM